MRKAILMMLLSVVSSGATAAWVEVFRDETVTVYADATTIRKTGDRATMWVLYDYKSVQSPNGGKPYRSSRKQSEYDCKKEQSRILSLTAHTGNMAALDTVFSLSQPEEWVPALPSSLADSMWKIACGRP